MFTRSLCAALLGATMVSAALAESRTLSTPWLDVHYDSEQLPDSRWQIWIHPSVYVYRVGDSWEYSGGAQLMIDPLAPGAGALGHLDLAVEFKGPVVTPLDGITELVSTASAEGASLFTVSVFSPPDGALLPVSAGLAQLTFRSGDDVVQSTLRPIAGASTEQLSQGFGPGNEGWSGAPRGAGLWHVSLDQQLVGSSHLMPSYDLGCIRLDCMPVQQSTADMQRFTMYFGMTQALRPVVSAVPEPGAGALLLAGCGVLAALRRRRSFGLALLGLTLGSAALAQDRTVSSPWLDVHYYDSQLPSGQHDLAIRSTTTLYRDASWVVFGGGLQFTIARLAGSAGALGLADLMLEFKGPVVTALDDTTELVSTAVPGSVSIMGSSLFVPPAGAQMAISTGLDELTVIANGLDVVQSTLRPVVGTSNLESINNLLPPIPGWHSAPTGTGSWQLSFQQQLSGSNHLLISTDPDCASLDCMPVQRGTAHLQYIRVDFAMVHELRPVASAVPEPGAGALLLAGCGVLAAVIRRRPAHRVG